MEGQRQGIQGRGQRGRRDTGGRMVAESEEWGRQGPGMMNVAGVHNTAREGRRTKGTHNAGARQPRRRTTEPPTKSEPKSKSQSHTGRRRTKPEPERSQKAKRTGKTNKRTPPIHPDPRRVRERATHDAPHTPPRARSSSCDDLQGTPRILRRRKTTAGKYQHEGLARGASGGFLNTLTSRPGTKGRQGGISNVRTGTAALGSIDGMWVRCSCPCYPGSPRRILELQMRMWLNCEKELRAKCGQDPDRPSIAAAPRSRRARGGLEKRNERTVRPYARAQEPTNCCSR
ncbi:hypothetical protein OH77DRAFT_1017457 [Trametes cingulata]|nr:hypothetical protein OH77DRAFT_1017457 [Trametes cingulata]